MAIRKSVEDIVRMTVPLVLMEQNLRPSNCYKATERRLRAYLAIRNNVVNVYPNDIADIKAEGVEPLKGKSIVVWTPGGGVKAEAEEIVAARVAIVEAKLRKDKAEMDEIDKALETIKDDPDCYIVWDHYVCGVEIEKLAEDRGVSPATITRAKNRLVRLLSYRLYGAVALE